MAIIAPSPELWTPHLQMTDGKRPKPYPNLLNAYTILEHDPAIREALMFDEMLRSSVLVHPVAEPDWNYERPEAVTDDRASEVQKWLQVAGLHGLNMTTTRQAIELYAKKFPFHPIRDKLDALLWDGTRRLESWLAIYLGVDCSDPNRLPYFRNVGRMFLIGMVARIYDPGCQMDYVLILEGEQGELKSKACRTLACGYFTDQLPELSNSRQVSLHLRGRWVIEIAEMHAFNKADATLFKSFVTRREEQYQPPYGHYEVTEKRQCVFIGTTNKYVYLKDETGNRRSWGVKVGRINIDALERDRDQLLAEAVFEYRDGANWWPDRPLERQYFQPEQEARFEPDVWAEKIINYLASESKVTVGQIAEHALGFQTSKIGRLDQNRITSILRELGWGPGTRGTGGVKFYYRVD